MALAWLDCSVGAACFAPVLTNELSARAACPCDPTNSGVLLEKFQDVVLNYGYDLNEYSACTAEEVTHAKEVAEALADHKRRMRARAEAQVQQGAGYTTKDRRA